MTVDSTDLDLTRCQRCAGTAGSMPTARRRTATCTSSTGARSALALESSRRSDRR